METCSNGHYKIVHDERVCPFCEKIAILMHRIIELEEIIENLESISPPERRKSDDT